MSSERAQHTAGDVILVPFPFTDTSERKVRPAVILSNRVRLSTVLVALITSQKTKIKEETDVLINKTMDGFEETGLKVASTVRVSQIATIHTKIIIGKIGSCNEKLKKEIDQHLNTLFD